MTQASPPAVSLKEAVQPYLNKWGPWRMTRDELNTTGIWRYLEVVEDGNPAYWDEDFAKQSRFGRLIAPPQGLLSFTFNPWWTPQYLTERINEQAASMNDADVVEGNRVNQLVNQYGYTVATVAGQEAEYLAPFGPGDGRIKMRGMTIDVSDEKQTRPGKGVFITSITEYRTEKDNKLIGRSRMNLLMYNPSSPRGQ